MLSVQNFLIEKCASCAPEPRPLRKSSPITISGGGGGRVHFRNSRDSEGVGEDYDLATSATSYYFCRGCGSFGTPSPHPPPHPHPDQQPTHYHTTKSRSVDSPPNYSSSPPTHPQPHPLQPHPPNPPPTTTPSSSSPSSTSTPSHTAKKTTTTTIHVATATDTLTSIAAKYETTPGELLKLNRLMSGRCVFPGMELKVPERVSDGNHGDEVFEVNKDKKIERKFAKIAVRHVTDGNGVVAGTLLITPNAVMFDPNVSDPLVIEQGAEMYGVILPLEIVIHAGIFSDIAMMKVEKGLEINVEERPKLYGAPSTKPHPQIPHPQPPPTASPTTQKKEKTLKRLSFPLTWMDSSSNEDLSEGIKRSSAPPTASHEKKRDSKSFLEEELSGCGASGSGGSGSVGAVKEMQGVLRKSFERLLPTTTQQPPPPPPPPLEPRDQPPLTTPEFTPLSASSEWYLLLTTAQPEFPSHQKLPLVVSYGQKNHLRPEYWFHIVIREQVQELYQFWMQSSPDTYSQEVDMQLLTTRHQKLTTFSTMDLTSAPPTLAIDVINKSPNKESWEMLKSPYTKLSSMISRSQTLLTSTSSSATNFGQGLLDSISDFASLDYNNEEVVSMSEELRAALYGFSNEDLLFLTPAMIGESELLKEEDLGRLARYLTPRAEGHPLTLLFTTSRDGFSLATLFRRNSHLSEDTPILLVIQETKNSKTFGALLSTPLRTSEVFYGTGQSFLFTLEPFGVWKWSGDNMYFVKGGADGIAIGAGDGKFGIWLDSDLNCGRSDACSTFSNPPLVEDSDFVINIIECWGFISETMTTEATTKPTEIDDPTPTTEQITIEEI